MTTEIKLPALGENVPGGDVVEVNVAVGDVVKAEQALFDVEAEKSTVSVPSPVAGRISQLNVKKGDHVATGQVVAVVEDGDGKPAKGAAAAPAPAVKEKAPAAEKAPADAAKEKAPAPQPAAEKAPADAAKEKAPAPQPVPAKAPPTDGGAVHAGPATR